MVCCLKKFTSRFLAVMPAQFLWLAVARAQDPVRMARAMRAGAVAGREAFLAGRMPRKFYAEASTTLAGRIAVGA